jgi:hypothetical protein
MEAISLVWVELYGGLRLQSGCARETETTAGIITRAAKDVPVKQTGYLGFMIPVLEDRVLTRRCLRIQSYSSSYATKRRKPMTSGGQVA